LIILRFFRLQHYKQSQESKQNLERTTKNNFQGMEPINQAAANRATRTAEIMLLNKRLLSFLGS
jgi:hypothetical protein